MDNARLIREARRQDERLPDGATRILVDIEPAALDELAAALPYEFYTVHGAAVNLLAWGWKSLRPRLADALESAQKRIDDLEAEVKRLSDPQWFYDADDPEYAYSDLGDVADNMDRDGVMRIAGAREVCKLWVAMRVLTVDAEGEPDDTEVAEFATEPEAVTSWETSLAAVREAARAAQIRHGVG